MQTTSEHGHHKLPLKYDDFRQHFSSYWSNAVKLPAKTLYLVQSSTYLTNMKIYTTLGYIVSLILLNLGHVFRFRIVSRKWFSTISRILLQNTFNYSSISNTKFLLKFDTRSTPGKYCIINDISNWIVTYPIGRTNNVQRILLESCVPCAIIALITIFRFWESLLNNMCDSFCQNLDFSYLFCDLALVCDGGVFFVFYCFYMRVYLLNYFCLYFLFISLTIFYPKHIFFAISFIVAFFESFCFERHWEISMYHEHVDCQFMRSRVCGTFWCNGIRECFFSVDIER